MNLLNGTEKVNVRSRYQLIYVSACLRHICGFVMGMETACSEHQDNLYTYILYLLNLLWMHKCQHNLHPESATQFHWLFAQTNFRF